MLCSCVSPAATTGDVRRLLSGVFDWSVLLDLAEEHSVQGMLASRLQEFAFAGVPLEAREKLQARMRLQHLFTLSMTAELFRILDGFAAAGIEAIAIKGPVTSVVAHGDPATRRFGDVDLLLRQKDIARASRTMQSQGFQAAVPDRAIEDGKVPGEYVFRRPATDHLVEIHTERTFRYYPNGMPIAEIFRRKRIISLEGHNVPALGLSDELIFHCVHGAKDFWERLMWICDVAALLKKYPQFDWHATQREAAVCGAARMLNVALLLAHRVLGAPLPSAMARAVESDRASRRLCADIEAWLPFGGGAPPSLPHRAAYRVRIAGGGIVGLTYLLRLAISPTEEDWTNGARHNRSWLFDAVRRPFRLIRKYSSENQLPGK